MTYRDPTVIEASLFVGGLPLGMAAGETVTGGVGGAIAGGLWILATGWTYANAKMAHQEATDA